MSYLHNVIRCTSKATSLYWNKCLGVISVWSCHLASIWIAIIKIRLSHDNFSCDQAALQMVFSVRLSIRPSVRPSVTPFWLCSHHRIIMKFSGVITNDQCKVHAKGQGQRSKVKVTEVTTQLNRFRTVTPVWIGIWWWNDAYSLMLLRRGALLFLAATKQLYKWYFPSVRPSVRLSVRLSVCL